MSAYQVDTDCLGRVLKAISKVGVYGPRYKEIQKLKDAYNKNAGKVFDIIEQKFFNIALSPFSLLSNISSMFFRDFVIFHEKKNRIFHEKYRIFHENVEHFRKKMNISGKNQIFH